MIKLSSNKWQELLKDYVLVYDPDGWDRLKYDESWTKEITLEEFKCRAANSTCIWRKNPVELCSVTEKGLGL